MDVRQRIYYSKKKLENKFESFMQQEILKISRTKQFSD